MQFDLYIYVTYRWMCSADINDIKYLNCTVKKKTEGMTKPLANQHVHSVHFQNTT